MAGRIFEVTDTSLLTIDNLTLQNGQAPSGSHGGAIHSSSGSVTVKSSTIANCRAGDDSSIYGGWGGAIYTHSGPVTVTSSMITGCRAGDGGIFGGHGGAIFTQDSPVTVTSSTITGCRAGDGLNLAGRGGAIYTSGGSVTVTSSTIANCRAGYGGMGHGGAIFTQDGTVMVTSSTITGCQAGNVGYGGAIFSGSGTVRFCRLIGNTAPDDGDTIYGSITARDNWWGSNTGHSAGDLGGGASAATWLVLGIAADPAIISTSGTSAVRANLTFNSTGSDTSADGHVPDGIPVAFAIGSGTGSVSPGEGNVTSGANLTTFTPAGTGTSTVSASVDGETVSTGITVTPYPITNFTAAPLTGIAPLAVQFTDTTDVAGGTMWNWSFGDTAWENTTATSDPVHTYMSSGIYTVSLTVTNADSSDTETKDSYVIVAKADQIVAGFTATPLAGTAPLTVQFTDTSTGPVYSWIWNFGSYNATDAGISSLQDPSHTYDAAGTYTITLTVNNTDGSSTLSRTRYVIVTAPGPGPVTASFANATPRTGTAPLTIDFTDTSTGMPDRWAWSFGDGGTSTDQHPSHTYATAGAYTVTLTAMNGSVSSTLSEPGYVTVTSVATPVVANFANATPRAGTVPLAVQFTDTSAGGPVAWLWSFGDGGTSTDRNPSHTYTAAGSYTVTLTAVNGMHTNTLAQPGYVTVTAVPTPAPTAAPVNPPSGGNSGTSSTNSGGSDSGTGPVPVRPGSIVLFADSAYLAGHGVAPADIRIMSYSGGRWMPLDTRFTGSSGNRFSFSADADTVSLFSIGNTKDGITGLPVIGVAATASPSVFPAPVTTIPSPPAETRTVSREETTVPAMHQPVAEPPAPAAAPAPAGSSVFPFMTPVLIVAGCVVLIGTGWYVRRWWIRRQNPALFEEY